MPQNSVIPTDAVTPIKTDNEAKIKVSAALDIAKVLVTILVIIGHITYYSKSDCRFPQIENSAFLADLTDIIYYFHMPLFFAISGGVFYLTKNLAGKYGTMKKLVTNKFSRLMIPYLFFISIVFIPLIMILGLSDSSYVNLLSQKVLTIGDLGWLWFLPTLFLIFIIFNVGHKYLLKHKIWLLIIFGICSMAYYVMPHKIFGHEVLISQIFKYCLYFYVGYLLVALGTSRKIKHNALLLSGTLLFFMLMIFAHFTIVSYSIPYIPLISSLMVALAGILAVFYLCYYISNKTDLNIYPVFRLFKKHSFGIYLFHDVFVLIAFYLLVGISISPYISATAVFVICLIGSLVLSAIFSKTPFLRSTIGLKAKSNTLKQQFSNIGQS